MALPVFDVCSLCDTAGDCVPVQRRVPHRINSYFPTILMWCGECRAANNGKYRNFDPTHTSTPPSLEALKREVLELRKQVASLATALEASRKDAAAAWKELQRRNR